MKLGRVTDSRITKNKDGDTDVILLQVELSDPNDIQSVEYVRQAGEDNRPPDDSAVIVLQIGESWKIAIAVDDLIAPTVDKGERELYSSDGGAKKARIKLVKDGQLELNGTGDFAVAFNDLKTAFNQLKTDFDNAMDVVDQHTHKDSVGGATTAPISPGPEYTPASPGVPGIASSTADIDPAKVATVELP